jgi:hypothetical protein
MLFTSNVCVLCRSQDKQRLFLYTALEDWFCITEVESVYCAVGTESLYITDTFHLQRVKTEHKVKLRRYELYAKGLRHGPWFAKMAMNWDFIIQTE